MKQILTILMVLFISSSSFAVVNMAIEEHDLKTSFENLDPMVQHMDMDEFLTLSPKKYRQMTGKRMGVKKALQLKVAQKVIKKATGRADTDIPKGVYILGCIFFFVWILMGVMDGWKGKNWWVNLVLGLGLATIIGCIGVFLWPLLLLLPLTFLAPIIHGLIKMKEYY